MIAGVIEDVLKAFLEKEVERLKLDDINKIALGIQMHIPADSQTGQTELYYYTTINGEHDRYVELDEVLEGIG